MRRARTKRGHLAFTGAVGEDGTQTHGARVLSFGIEYSVGIEDDTACGDGAFESNTETTIRGRVSLICELLTTRPPAMASLGTAASVTADLDPTISYSGSLRVQRMTLESPRGRGSNSRPRYLIEGLFTGTVTETTTDA